MKSSSLSLQGAILSRLSNDIDVSSRVNGVFDDVEQGTDYPYISFGDEEEINDHSTKNEGGESVFFDVHVWSDYPGKKECKEIMNAVLQSITETPFALTGFHVIGVFLESMNIFVDADGVTRHGVLSFEFKIMNK